MRLTLPLSVVATLSLVAFAAPALATASCYGHGSEDGWFPDVGGCFSSYPAIKYVREEGIVQGYPDGTFKPDAPINRAEFVKILAKASPGWPPGDHCGASPKSKYFSDVTYPANDWFSDYVCYATEEGWIDGYPDNTFRPGNLINYAEAAKIAANAYGLPFGTADEWDDRWYAPYTRALLDRHAVPPTTASYGSALTRGEMAEMIYRLETGKTSMDWFASLGSESYVISSWVTDLFPELSFVYDGTSFSAKEGTMSVPDAYANGGSRTFSGLHLTHVRPRENAEGCNDMAGVGPWCRPSLSMLDISIGIVDRPVEYLALGMAWRDAEAVDPVAGRADIRGFWEGVECEGVRHAFIPLDERRSVVVTRTYDCNEQPEEYLSGDEQEHIFRMVLDSFSTDIPAPRQDAPTMDISLLFCDAQAPGPLEGGVPSVHASRAVPRASAVADTMLRALFAGRTVSDPANAMDCPGVSSMGALYRGVSIANGVATVKLAASFDDWRASDQSDSKILEQSIVSAQRSVAANLKQFPSVQSVRYVVQP